VKGIEVIAVQSERPSIEGLGLVMPPLLVEGDCRFKRL
jgi:hypothetical protein